MCDFSNKQMNVIDSAAEAVFKNCCCICLFLFFMSCFLAGITPVQCYECNKRAKIFIDVKLATFDIQYSIDVVPVTTDCHSEHLNNAYTILTFCQSICASRAFSVSVPSVWNLLKPNLCSIDSAASFNSHLNTTLSVSYTHLTLPTNREV